SPFLSVGLAAPAFGLDVTQLRDVSGRPIFPAGQIRGVIRNGLEVLIKHGFAGAKPVLAMFGDMDNEASGEGEPGRIRFRDLRATEPEEPQSNTRIRINETTGAVEQGHLLVTEIAWPIGKHVSFAGKVAFFAASLENAKTIRDVLEKAVMLVQSIGAFKTSGFGRIEKRELGAPELLIDLGAAPTPLPAATRYKCSFMLDGALLVDTSRPEHNVLRTDTVISGAVLKGALAAMICDATAGEEGKSILTGSLGDALSKAVFGPARATPAPIPASILQAGDFNDPEKNCDAVDATGVPVSDFSPGGTRRQSFIAWPAAFSPDFKSAKWKEGQEPDAGGLPLESRTRLAIDYDAGAADQGKLFSQEFVPAPIGDTDNPLWQCEISWPDSEPDAEFYQLLAWLKRGLFSIGKLKAGAVDVTVEALDTQGNVEVALGDRLAIVLQSPCWMLRAEAMAGETQFTAAVEAYFKQASNGAFALARLGDDPAIFAQQQIRGGFQVSCHAPFGSDLLEPFILVSPGSVFVLEVIDAELAGKVLATWKTSGLPDLTKIGIAKAENAPPYLSENGFGAISIGKPGELLNIANGGVTA
ncbi:MAG: hypothetical protein KDJ66_12180, partial [Nitratireductor sp.]|nr:hypothetical protein [Nitratireductor sp.]